MVDLVEGEGLGFVGYCHMAMGDALVVDVEDTRSVVVRCGRSRGRTSHCGRRAGVSRGSSLLFAVTHGFDVCAWSRCDAFSFFEFCHECLESGKENG